MREKYSLIPVFFSCFILVVTSAMAGGVKQLREENKALKSQLQSAVSRISDTESRIGNLQAELDVNDQELKEMRSDLDALEVELKELEELLRTEGSELLKEVMSLQEKKAILDDQVESLENDLAITNRQVEELNLLVADYQEQLKESNDEISVLERSVDDLRSSHSAQGIEHTKQIERLNAEKQHLEDEISRLEKNVEELRSTLTEQGSASSRQISELNARNDELVAELYDLTNALSALQNTLDARDAEYSEKLASLSSENENLEKRLTQLNSEKKNLEKQTAGLKKELDMKLKAEEADKEKMKKTYDQLVSSLRKEVGEKTIEVQNYENALTINILEKIFFDSGKAVIKPEGLDVLRRVGDIIKNLHEKVIRIEGHTDDVPIGPKLVSVYPNNWELGAARASNVAEYFRTKSGIKPENLMVVSYSMYKPVVPNTSEQNRARNRRIEIVLQDKSYYEMIRAVESKGS